MKQSTLARSLKVMLALGTLCLLAVYLIVIPSFGVSMRTQYPEFSNRFWPWLGFLWATALPCLAAVGLGWRVASGIGRDRAFTVENAALLRAVAWLAAGDAGFFLIGNVVLLFLSMSHPGIALLSLLVVCAGLAIAVAAAALSHLVGKAAALQEQSDWTI